MSGSRSPATRAAPLTEALGDAIANRSNDQRTVVVLAAEFADSGEWAACGSPSAVMAVDGVRTGRFAVWCTHCQHFRTHVVSSQCRRRRT